MTIQPVRQVKRLLLAGVIVLLSLWLASSALAALPTDTSMSDFNGGDMGSCYVGPSTWDGGVDGEVILSPTLATGFPGTNVPADWYTGVYGTPNSFVVANDFITVDVAYAGVTPLYGPNRTLEFEAVFNGPNQWVGFASDTNLSGIPWALFGTFGSGADLYANTNYNAGNTQVITAGLGVPHRFRIDWISGLVSYYIDDVLVATHNVDITGSMRPIIADNAGGSLLSVDWLRVGSYAPTGCTYTSRLFDSGIVNPHWITLTASVYVPASTTLSFETRSGDVTDTTDPSWSAWQAVAGSSIVSPNRRYLQYRALLGTTDPLATPRVYSVQPQGETPTAVAVSRLTGQPTVPVLDGWTSLLVIGLGVLGLLILGYHAMKARQARS